MNKYYLQAFTVQHIKEIRCNKDHTCGKSERKDSRSLHVVESGCALINAVAIMFDSKELHFGLKKDQSQSFH